MHELTLSMFFKEQRPNKSKKHKEVENGKESGRKIKMRETIMTMALKNKTLCIELRNGMGMEKEN